MTIQPEAQDYEAAERAAAKMPHQEVKKLLESAVFGAHLYRLAQAERLLRMAAK